MPSSASPRLSSSASVSLPLPLLATSSADGTDESRWRRLRFYVTPMDGRYEDLLYSDSPVYLQAFRDVAAALIVAMIAIPLAMGLAIASNLNPVHGIVGGAVAGLVGALFGGSKYQVYGPTAALIPIIANIMQYPEGATYAQHHAMLVALSIIAGIVLICMGIEKLGQYVALVPHSIVVGFTIGIAVTIFLSEVGEVLGLQVHLSYKFLPKVEAIWGHLDEFNIYCLILSVATFIITKALLMVSVFIPAPLIALAICTLISSTAWTNVGLVLIIDRYGMIPSNLLKFTPPSFSAIAGEPLSMSLFLSMGYNVLSIVLVASIESLLCSRMADRLAHNTRLPYNPNKELFGQGLVNIICPLLNGFPHTGALARTATNIKVGAVSPLAGVLKCVFKLLLAALLARFLERIPMACIGGILSFVAYNMISPMEINQVYNHSSFQCFLMIWTAVVVIVVDFLTGVLSGLALFWLFGRWLDVEQFQGEKAALIGIRSSKMSSTGESYLAAEMKEEEEGLKDAIRRNSFVE